MSPLALNCTTHNTNTTHAPQSHTQYNSKSLWVLVCCEPRLQFLLWYMTVCMLSTSSGNMRRRKRRQACWQVGAVVPLRLATAAAPQSNHSNRQRPCKPCDMHDCICFTLSFVRKFVSFAVALALSVICFVPFFAFLDGSLSVVQERMLYRVELDN